MAVAFEFSFVRTAKISDNLAVVLKALDGDAVASGSLADPGKILPRAIKIARYVARLGAVLDLVAPEGSPFDRLMVMGLGRSTEMVAHDWMKVGGATAARVFGGDNVTVFLDVPGMAPDARAVADFALGMVLRVYEFDRYKTARRNADEEPKKPARPPT